MSRRSLIATTQVSRHVSLQFVVECSETLVGARQRCWCRRRRRYVGVTHLARCRRRRRCRRKQCGSVVASCVFVCFRVMPKVVRSESAASTSYDKSSRCCGYNLRLFCVARSDMHVDPTQEHQPRPLLRSMIDASVTLLKLRASPSVPLPATATSAAAAATATTTATALLTERAVASMRSFARFVHR
jgi:hypothetical protein